MKALNTMKFVSASVENLTEYKAAIAASETFAEAMGKARIMLGYIDCLITFNNAMICKDNNEFTADFGDLLEGWLRKMYQGLVDKAIETEQDNDTVWRLLQKRDEHSEA